MTKRIEVYAHRGASGHFFENSMRAIDFSRFLHADGVEIDVQVSKDGQLFVIHDVHLKRITGKNALITDLAANEIKLFKIGKKFFRFWSRQKIPMIEQVVSWANEHEIPLNIEIKESLFNNEQPIIEYVKHANFPQGSHFSSFNAQILQSIKAVRPDVQTALIVTKKFPLETLHEYSYVDYLHAHKRMYNRRFLQAASASRKYVRVYGIDGKEKFLNKLHPQVIGLITDFPDKVKTVIHRKKS